MNSLIKFPEFISVISSPFGRLIRVAAGVALIVGGASVQSKVGYFISAAGLVPLLAGAFDICVLGGVLGGPYKGDAMRQALHKQNDRPELGNKSATFFGA